MNKLSRWIPNFRQISAFYETPQHQCIIGEFVQGQTLQEYIEGSQFQWWEFLFIISQLLGALEFAHKKVGFIHWDLTPWNIILHRLPDPVKIQYLRKDAQILEIETQLVPIILDYGKSRVIANNRHWGYIRMFDAPVGQDTYTILITSLSQILEKQTLRPTELKSLFSLMNILLPHIPFDNLKKIKKFLRVAKKYENIIRPRESVPKGILTQILGYLLNILPPQKFRIRQLGARYKIPHYHQPTQIITYLAARNRETRLGSYLQIFEKLPKDLLNGTFGPRDPALFLHLYENIIHNLKCVKQDCETNITRISLGESEKMSLRISQIENNHKKVLPVQSWIGTPTPLGEDPPGPPGLHWDENTFLNPPLIRKIQANLGPLGGDPDYTTYKHIIEIVINGGRDPELKKYLRKKYSQLLSRDLIIRRHKNTLHSTFLIMVDKIIKNPSPGI